MSSTQPVISVDPVLLRFNGTEVLLGLITRGWAPFKGDLALPGVMLNAAESVADAARRGVTEKAGVEPEQVTWQHAGGYTDAHNRDPRGASISLTHVMITRAHGGDDTTWCPLGDLPDLPFAHRQIVDDALELVRSKFWSDTGVIPGFLGETFTTRQVLALAGALGVEASSANTARRLGSMFEVTDELHADGRGHPARVFRAV